MHFFSESVKLPALDGLQSRSLNISFAIHFGLSMAYWLLVERLENWRTDKEEGFRHFGIPDRKLPLASGIKTGDTLIVYVSSGVSKFTDVRRARRDGAVTLGAAGNYDMGFPVAIQTIPEFALEQAHWVPMKGLADKLSLTAGRAEWRHVMRHCLRRLTNEDGEIILAAMRKARQ